MFKMIFLIKWNQKSNFCSMIELEVIYKERGVFYWALKITARGKDL